MADIKEKDEAKEEIITNKEDEASVKEPDEKGKKKEKEKKEKDPITFFTMVKKIYPICFFAKPSYFIFNQSVSIFHGVSHGFAVLINQMFFDSILNATMGKSSVNFAFLMLVVYAMTNIVKNLLNAVHNFSHSVNWTRIWGFISVEIEKKSSLINPAEYENPKRLDDINKAINGADPAIHFMLTTSTLVTFYLPYFIFMAFYLYNLSPLLILSIVFVFIPTFISQILRSSIFSKLEDKAAPIRREFEAYSGAISDRAFLKETRMLGAFAYLKKLYVESIESLNKAIWHANKRSNIIDACFRFLSLVGYAGILIMLVYLLVVTKEISIGAFAAVYNSVGLLFGIMEEIISGHIGHLSTNFGLIRNLLRFLDIPVENREKISINKKSDIVISNASFRYPNAEHDSLKEINLTIKKGETVAIVGANGAGKTTLVKLITGLYNPTVGDVKIDGTDIKYVEYKTLFENLTGVYQKYQRYKMTLEDNIRISDSKSEKPVEPVLDENGININDTETFPSGISTMLSREFDGVDLSGGQWQRIAIARGFYRDSDIIVLDEPTAAIDPIEESNIYRKFIEVAKEKTAIIVTHRMGSARIAEKIIVMNDGMIEQAGSHEALLESGGTYAEMYNAQSGWYN